MSDLDQALAPAPLAADACQAVDAILCSACGFERLDAWRHVLSARLEARLPPPRRAALLQRLGIIALLRDGDLVAAGQHFAQAIERLDPVDPNELLLRAQAGIADCLAGRLVRADVQLSDAELASRAPGISVLTRGWLAIALALNRLLRGDAAMALELLAGAEAAIPDQGPAGLLRLELALYAAALLGRRDQVTALSGRLALALIPRRLTLLEAGRHFVLGVAALRQGEALRALVHAEEGASAGARAGARLALLLTGLLRAQALAGLQRLDEARQLLLQLGPDWSRLGLNHLAAMGRLELARLEANAGEQDRARQALAAARALLPAGEPLPSLHRGPDWLLELECRLDGSPAPASSAQAHVRIHTLGEFRVEIKGRRLYDRDWKGQRTKSLLLALIGEGGYKVPAERLSDLLWPDSDGDQAAQNLKVALHRLRRLGCAPDEAAVNWVHVKHGHVSLSRSLCWVDAHACCN
ncbi:MAG: hypothetical protein NTX37_03575 [Burkholderiales bacterium]|nr:hypothetical protein [Burkholderiales bacterium]